MKSRFACQSRERSYSLVAVASDVVNPALTCYAAAASDYARDKGDFIHYQRQVLPKSTSQQNKSRTAAKAPEKDSGGGNRPDRYCYPKKKLGPPGRVGGKKRWKGLSRWYAVIPHS